MKRIFHIRHLLFVFITLILSSTWASEDLVIHTTEFGVGKFYRIGNKIHPYTGDSLWRPFILPENANANQALVRKNSDGSFTVFFSTLDEMVSSVIQLSRQEGKKVSILNVHGHGLPGAMWFPKDAQALSGLMCWSWQQAANGSDGDNYRQYYSPVSKSQVMQIRAAAENPGSSFMGCTTGLKEWKSIVGLHPEFIQTLANDVQISLLSCVVGLGKAGEAFTKGLAEFLLANKSQAKVQTSVNFGMGDWSIFEGMGFWDYISDSQIEHDNLVYPVNQKDRELAQKGTIRLAQFTGAWQTKMIGNQDFMIFDRQNIPVGPEIEEIQAPISLQSLKSIRGIRIPGTNATVDLIPDSGN